MNALRLAAAGVLVLTLACAARGDEKAPKKSETQDKLVGAWEVVKGDKAKGAKGSLPPGTTVEFTKDGKLIMTVKGPDDKTVSVEGNYKLDGDTKVVATATEGERESRETTIEIVKLTATELVVKDEQGKTDTFKKVK